MNNPAVLFYTSDFLSGVILFSDEDIGQYIKLLCMQHQIFPEHFPENHMISICKSINSPVIKKFKKDSNGNYYNEIMEKRIIERLEYCKSRSNNKSGRPKNKSHDKSHDESYDKHMGNRDENENKIEIRKEKFKEEVIKFKDKYSIATLKEFFEYWSEHGTNDKKMRFEKQDSFGISRRLATWKRNESKFNTTNEKRLDEIK